MKSQKLTFANFQGEQLVARLELPADRHPHAYALFAHCFTCNKNLTAVKNISRSLTVKGIAVLRFDFTGLGESEGDFADTNFSSNVDDLIAAAKFLEEEYQAPSLLMGHSLGGAAVIFAAQQLASVKAVATIGAPAGPQHVSHLFKSGIEEIESSGEALVSIGGREFTIKKQFLEDIRETNIKETVSSLGKALLVLHSPQDSTVGIENAKMIYKAAKHPKSFVSLDGADHLLSNKIDSLYVGDIIACWVSHYEPLPKANGLNSNSRVVVRLGEEGYTTEIKAGKHGLIADEPESVGGNDFGPTPYDYVSAGLGACTAMTLKMYADRKGWDLGEIHVHLEHSKDYNTDCEDCDEPTAKIDHFNRVIEMTGNLTSEQQAKLLIIADKCPVHKTLHNEVKVNTELRVTD